MILIRINSSDYFLRLTLQALMEIENLLDVHDIPAIGKKLTSLSAREILEILNALLKGGGNPVDISDLACADISISDATQKIATTFVAAFAQEAVEDDTGKQPGAQQGGMTGC